MAQPEKEKFPVAFQISRQLDQEKINFLAERIEELLKSNNELRSSSSQNEKDTHDIVLYFQREMEIKDDIILRLNEELVKCQTQLKFEVEKVRKSFETELADIKSSSEHQISDLQMKLSAAESDLKAIEIYRQEKDRHEEIIQKLEKNMQNQREQLIDAMEEQERRFLEEKSQIFKDLDDQKAAFREIALKEARSAMGEEARKILADNNRMFEELKFHHSEAADFQAEKNRLTAELVTSKRDVAILAEKEIEYAKQAYNRTKEIKALRERVEQLEKQQSVNIERFKLRAKELKSTVTKELEEATLDAAGLRRLIHIKNKELRHMKSLATTILTQRTETEQFFLEALHEVKEVIRTERKKKTAQETKSILNKLKTGGGAGNTNDKQYGIFPPLNIKGQHLHHLEQKQSFDIPISNLEKVNIRDLSWEDKELVLRVLFSKMNGAQSNITKPGAGITNAFYSNKRGSGDKPVFVSEGANLPPMDAEQAGLYQGNFELRRTMTGDSAEDYSQYSKGDSFGGNNDNDDIDYDNDNAQYFDDSIKSSQKQMSYGGNHNNNSRKQVPFGSGGGGGDSNNIYSRGGDIDSRGNYIHNDDILSNSGSILLDEENN